MYRVAPVLRQGITAQVYCTFAAPLTPRDIDAVLVSLNQGFPANWITAVEKFRVNNLQSREASSFLRAIGRKYNIVRSSKIVKLFWACMMMFPHTRKVGRDANFIQFNSFR